MSSQSAARPSQRPGDTTLPVGPGLPDPPAGGVRNPGRPQTPGQPDEPDPFVAGLAGTGETER